MAKARKVREDGVDPQVSVQGFDAVGSSPKRTKNEKVLVVIGTKMSIEDFNNKIINTKDGLGNRLTTLRDGNEFIVGFRYKDETPDDNFSLSKTKIEELYGMVDTFLKNKYGLEFETTLFIESI